MDYYSILSEIFFKNKEYTKGLKLLHNLLPEHVKRGPIGDLFQGIRYILVKERRNKESTDLYASNYNAIVFFEFFRIPDSQEKNKMVKNDQWVKEELFDDKIYVDRCKTFYQAHKEKVDFNFEYVIGETVSEMYKNNEDIPKLSDHFWLNILLHSKISFIKVHFNLVFNFYKDYKMYDSFLSAIKDLSYTYQKAINDSHNQLNIIHTQILGYRFNISKETSDKFANDLFSLFDEKLKVHDPNYKSPFEDAVEIYIDDLNQFSKVINVSPQDIRDYLPLQKSENEIQNALERIIGENFHQEDWGGESNDLFTSFLTFKGRRLNSAFLLKGRGTKGKLTIKKCGKNGDQILRLIQSKSEIYFIQHTDEISQEVRHDLALKIELKRLKGERVFFCIIDGTDTARILKAYGYL